MSAQTDDSDLIDTMSVLQKACAQDVVQFRAGGLKSRIEFWKKHCSDPAILKTISGLTIPVIEPFYQSSIPKEHMFHEKEHDIIGQEIKEMLSQGVIAPVSNSPERGEYISNIFARKKKDGGYRIILNLRRFNDFVEKSHFKMNSLQSAIDLMAKGAFMASVDFKSAYYSVSIKKSHRKYLRFFYRGQKYEFCCLPNGLSTGPRDFTQVVKTLFRILREKGYLNTFYLDDSFLTHDTFSGCLQNVLDTVELSRSAGFVVHPIKSVLIPTRELVFLGFVLNSVSMTVRLTTEKVTAITGLITNLLAKHCFVIQEIAELIGKLVATFPAVPMGKLYYRQLDIDKSRALKMAKGDYSSSMILSAQARFDLKWWVENLKISHSKIESKNPDFTMKTDASIYGFGGCRDHDTVSGQWTVDEQELHINLKELMAVLYSLQKLCHDCSDCTIKVLTDNTTTMAYINGMGGKIQSCHSIARKIWEWAIARNIWLVCSFIPGKCNTEADKLSRLLNETTEWSLDGEMFGRVMKCFPGITVDLFASHLNNKLPTYVSWLPDKNALHCDAFTLNWFDLGCVYAFPPFNLIGKVLKKVELDGCEMVLIVPEWKTQYWFSKLMSMLVDVPLFLPRNGRAIHNALNNRAPKITARFIACRISGLKRKTDIFRNQ